ncbi:Molybdopterin or thiamine biosynthesis adenylyltransferase [Thalassovita litoralis]|jgi:molybdopterin/thiamine biosynthesis adenylyltransferase|uniref:Molybdopterin-synthase adenylyltransferase n=1 Tax=Thalassovita litoralis TaxID=1010611 RepID=A0A521DD07_9RHOB|nr:HesA/MoeB/ThiF family protein [Thalassovita litoralis]SMO69031.1 Molybdopterin or thiamine biosynthesis adenylyltransferase [Thalassovita litoralis]
MALILFLAAALWGMGVVLKVPQRVRAIMLGLLWLAIVGLHLLLPDAHPLRASTGGSAAPWLLLGGFVGLVQLYRIGLRWLRGRVAPVTDPAPQGAFSEVELNRYARHIVLREIGGKGQKKLKNARVLVIGAGGLGSPVLLYLAAAGVGTIGVIDDDEVDNSNLQRQVIHPDAAIGMPKVFSAQKAMEAQNPFVTVRPYRRRLTPELAAELFADYDLVLDGTDNFSTRYMANAAAVARGIPLVSGALSQWEGQISVFDPATGGPCYQCVFPQAPAAGLAPSCAEAGVIGPLPGVIGTMMAVEAVKLLTGAGAPLRGEMLIYDALWGETRKIALKKRGDCPICGETH